MEEVDAEPAPSHPAGARRLERQRLLEDAGNALKAEHGVTTRELDVPPPCRECDF